MRSVCPSLLFLLTLVPGVSDAQPFFTAQVSAGGLLNTGGNVQSVSVGYSPAPRVILLAGAERSHVPSEVNYYENGYSASRGGTLRFLTAELRIPILPARRVSPYVLAGAGKGVSRPNVSALFPDVVKNDATTAFVGAGLSVAVGRHLALLGDARFSAYGENGEAGLLLPIRGGVSWRF